MSLRKAITAAGIVAALFSSSMAVAGETVRPGDSLVRPTNASLASMRNVRASAALQQKNSLLGAPLFLVFLGTIVITIGTIIIIHNNDNPTSP